MASNSPVRSAEEVSGSAGEAQRPDGAARVAIASPDAAATLAARKVIEQGGNAVDAAAAAMLTLCVVMPQQVGMGGYGGSMVLYLAAERRVVAIDFDSVAPRAFRRELYPNAQVANHGYLAVTVPAIIAGLGMAVKEHGRLPFAAACAHAAEVAERGFPVSEVYRRQIEQWAGRTDPVSLNALFAGGRLPAVGELWVQKDKAKLLRTLAAEGPEAFYHGEIARRIVRQIQAHGGILTEEDFAEYRPRTVEALEVEYRGHRVLTPPPPSGGLTTLQLLTVLEQFEVGKMEPFGAEYFHLFAEATKRCWADRHATAGDPDFVAMPIAQLLSKERAAEKAAAIRAGGIGMWPGENAGGSHTANVLVSDREGNLVSTTATQGYLFGSQVVIDGLGLVLGHGMSRFDLEPANAPNAPAVGKRMFHNMAPTIVLKDGRPRFAVGLPGGPKIVTVTAQLLVDLVDFGLSPAEAVAAPRIHIETAEPIAASSKVSEAVLEELRRAGHQTIRGQTVGGPPTEIAGMANALAIDANTGTPAAASQGGPDAAAVF